MCESYKLHETLFARLYRTGNWIEFYFMFGYVRSQRDIENKNGANLTCYTIERYILFRQKRERRRSNDKTGHFRFRDH